MILKKIEMMGFKSFADKRNIEFENGVTGIVGPNGCGKSNVGDAIRWVLGEQSSKMLRGKNMEDVIFKGTKERKQLSYCEVSLFFDNTTRVFDLDIDDIIITRKLYRNGVSDYLLNNKNVRLKDIIDLLHDSGIGKDSYCIIGQGKVDEIINAKPEDRRGIFEEAAGVAKFKAKKKETEAKLARVRENLTRQADIMSEVEKQIGPLKRQSEDAKKYLELKHNLRHHEVNTYITQYDGTKDAKTKISNIIEGMEEEIGAKQSDLEAQNRKYSNALEKQQLADSELKSLNEDILNLSLDIQKLGSDNELLRERVSFINNDISSNERVVKENSEIINQLNARVEEINTQIERNKIELASVNKKYTETTKMYMDIAQKLTDNEGENEEANNQIMQELKKLTDIKANMSKLTAEKTVLEESNVEIENKLISLQEKFKENEQIINEINISNSGVDVRKKNLESKVQTYKESSENLELEMKLVEKSLNEITTNFKLKNDRYNLINTMQADFEGYASSVQKLLRASKTNLNISNNIVGIIGKLISVPEKFETAIEITLGSAIHNIVTKNEDDAKYLIKVLKENEFGRVTFLPITSMKPKFVSAEVVKELKQIEGYIGVASEVISYDAKVKNVIDSLLGATIIADNLENAVKIAKKLNYAFKIVTLAGDVLSPAGSMTGGSKKSSAGNLLSRDRELETLKIEIEKLQKEQESKSLELDKLSANYQEAKSKYEENYASLNKLNIEFAGVFEKIERYEDYNLRLKQEINEYENSLSSNKLRIADILADLSSVDKLEEDVNRNINKANEKKNKNASFDLIKKQKEDITKTLSEIRVETTSKEYLIMNLDRELQQVTQDIARSNEIINNCNKIIDDKKLQLHSLIGTEQGVREQGQIKEKEEALNICRRQIAQLEEGKRIIKDTLIEIDGKRNDLNNTLNSLEKKKVSYEMQLQKIDIDLQNMQDRIYEEYELTYQTCLPFKVADYDIKEGQKQIVELKKEINKLGAVNVNAINEYQEVSERYEYLTEQTQDAEKAEAELIEIINDLSKEMTTRFNDAFTIINKNFGRIFSELFGGGNATLELIESENQDPLEAGIDIQAEPPGKKLQAMTLLSGGEKALTAIAILFAILKLRPMPFCLLDEIEAALDDANVGRFAQYLKKFSQETQFIVITHRKPTMELADRLFGVTMEEPGISKIVSVNLCDAVKAAEDN